MRLVLKESMMWGLAILSVAVMLPLFYFSGMVKDPPQWLLYVLLVAVALFGAAALLSPRISDRGKTRICGVALFCVFFLTLFIMTGCGTKHTPATAVLYEGGLVTNADGKTYPSSGKVVQAYFSVKECMGLADVELPEPKLRALAGGNAVPCGVKEDGTPKLKDGCYVREGDAGWIIVPQGAETATMRHEMVHHFLYETTGDLDAAHESPYFSKCGVLVLLD